VDKIENNPILTEQQKILLKQFMAWPHASVFYLTGGTALSAFYLHHRLSEDLDFFTEDDVEAEPILTFLRSIPEVQELKIERKFDRKIFLISYLGGDQLRAEFTKYPFKTINPVKTVEGIQVDSKGDILVNKLMALADRKDIKDYVDIYFILKDCPELSIDEMIEKTEQKFGIKGLKYILQGRFLECPEKGVELLNMKKECQGKEMATFFRGLARRLIKKGIEKEK
jgi:predicted nucleotidyltransferase component of viral defense system